MSDETLCPNCDLPGGGDIQLCWDGHDPYFRLNIKLSYIPVTNDVTRITWLRVDERDDSPRLLTVNRRNSCYADNFNCSRCNQRIKREREKIVEELIVKGSVPTV